MIKLKKVLPAVGIVTALLLITAVSVIAYRNSSTVNKPLLFSKNDTLMELWNSSKVNTIEPGTNRTLDKQQQNITTSEGQSYSMLRAVWMDDKQQFDESFQWAKDNLQRDDFLFSWKFGLLPDGSYGIQETVGGRNTATDGDSDIALALLMAYSRWRDDDYLFDAKKIINSIWEKEVVIINGEPVLVANDLERLNPDEVIVNPSYFSPYAYKIFAQVDPTHDWKGLTDNSYEILTKVSELKLDKESSVGLPPDWVKINRKNGAITASNDPNLTTNFGFDAMRTPFRLALDYMWFEDERAKEVLSKYSFLKDEWDRNGELKAVYRHNGTVAEDYEAPPAIYGGTIGYFIVMHPEIAKKIATEKLASLYDPDGQNWEEPLSYYDDNWAWFGLAMAYDSLPNLTSPEER